MLQEKPLRRALPTVDKNAIPRRTTIIIVTFTERACRSRHCFKRFRTSLDPMLHAFLTFPADSVATETASPAPPA